MSSLVEDKKVSAHWVAIGGENLSCLLSDFVNRPHVSVGHDF